jgi:uncharacterized lipoprotein
MSDTQHSLPWLERLAVSLPGYGGYRSPTARRQADHVLREAIAHRLEQARRVLDQAIHDCRARGAESEVAALNRINTHLDAVHARVRAASGGVDPFFGAGEFRSAKADALHAIDHALLDLSDEFVALVRRGDPDHDWLAKVEQRLHRIEMRLDDRARIHQMAAV